MRLFIHIYICPASSLSLSLSLSLASRLLGKKLHRERKSSERNGVDDAPPQGMYTGLGILTYYIVTQFKPHTHTR
uniref:Putative secreted protein n=1 Tax=Anopheles triannulatus TaxID=58253 RepID=A0A2M4B2F1_9DIPT